MSLPVVKRDEKGILTLFVHDRPFFMRSGEIHNSSASDPVYLEEKLWPALRGMNLNTVIVPLYWELIEHEEGRYDFSLLETIVASARREGLKLYHHLPPMRCRRGKGPPGLYLRDAPHPGNRQRGEYCCSHAGRE